MGLRETINNFAVMCLRKQGFNQCFYRAGLNLGLSTEVLGTNIEAAPPPLAPNQSWFPTHPRLLVPKCDPGRSMLFVRTDTAGGDIVCRMTSGLRRDQ